MSVRHLAETTRNMTQQYIKDNIAAALTGVRADRTDGFVNLEPPQSYFIFPKALGLKTPTIFTVVEEFDFRPSQKGANHINAMVKLHVTALVEDKDLDRLTIKADRYFDALHNVLAQAQIVDAGKGVRLNVIVSRATFSPEYSNANQQDPQGLFRKEVLLECEIEHYSNF